MDADVWDSLVGRCLSRLLTFLFAWLVLPGRQLSLAVLMHDAGHGSLFKIRALNQWVGQWLCALPTLGDLHSYARGHTAHHKFAGSHDDPDLPNYQSYPISRDSLYRKWRRDLLGTTGLKLLRGLASGTSSQMSRETHGSSHLVAKQILVHGVFIARFISSRYWLDLVRLDVHISDVLHVGGALKTGRGARCRNRPL